MNMIRQCPRPEILGHLDDGFYFIEGFNEKCVYAYMGIDFTVSTCALLHLEILKFSPDILKELMCDWANIKKILQKNDVKTVAATRLGVLSDHKKWIRFIKFFGFNNPQEHVTVSQEI